MGVIIGCPDPPPPTPTNHQVISLLNWIQMQMSVGGCRPFRRGALSAFEYWMIDNRYRGGYLVVRYFVNGYPGNNNAPHTSSPPPPLFI